MRRKKLMMFSALICGSLVMCSCGNRQEVKEESKQQQSEVKEKGTVEEVIKEAKTEKIDSGKYNNLEFKNDYYIDVPDVKEVSEFTLEHKSRMSAKEMKEVFDKGLDTYFKGVYSDKEKVKLYKFTSEELDKKNNKSGGWYSYSKYQKELETGNISMDDFFFSNKKGYMEVGAYGSCQVNRGTIAQMNHEKTVGMGMAANSDYEMQEYIRLPYEFNGTQSYNLMNGEISVKDAKDFVKDYLESKHPSGNSNPEIKAEPVNVEVYKIQDNVLDYCFGVTQSYHGIRFDYLDSKDSFTGSNGSSDKNSYLTFTANVDMLNKDQIEGVFGYETGYNVKDEKNYNEIITYPKAMEIISQQLSGKAKLECIRTEFLYSQKEKSEGDSSTLYLKPEWKVTAYNKTDHLLYVLYVNAIDGSFHYESGTVEKADEE